MPLVELAGKELGGGCLDDGIEYDGGDDEVSYESIEFALGV